MTRITSITAASVNHSCLALTVHVPEPLVQICSHFSLYSIHIKQSGLCFRVFCALRQSCNRRSVLDVQCGLRRLLYMKRAVWLSCTANSPREQDCVIAYKVPQFAKRDLKSKGQNRNQTLRPNLCVVFLDHTKDLPVTPSNSARSVAFTAQREVGA